jgi:hypothetical protein
MQHGPFRNVNKFATSLIFFFLTEYLIFSIKTNQIKNGIKGAFFMVCPWFIHGSSIEKGEIDGQTMDKPWRNHGQTQYQTYGNLY